MSFFDIFTKEWDSSWNDTDVVEWKKKAKGILKSYYMAFAGKQWDNYGEGEKIKDKFLLAKICYAMFGNPTNELAVELHDGYTDEQKGSASSVMEKIMEIYKEVPSEELLVAIIFISCKKEEHEFVLPLFCVFASGDPTDPRAEKRYVDTQKRAYRDWDDWKENNTLPMLKYAYPRHGFFTSSRDCKYSFNSEVEPDICFETSPQCAFSSRFFRGTDIFSAFTSLGCGGIAVASVFTPIAPAVLLVSAISGAGSALYGTTRSIIRLVDKGTHNESLGDFESMMLYFSIAATPLNFTTSLVNASLVKGATVNGRIFSSSTRMFATIINFSTLGVDAVLVGFGLANMIEKYKNDQLTTLDVLQFSMSLFFFTNTLIKPQLAKQIIKNAQEQHIQGYANAMSDEAARATFNKFVSDNAGTGSIKDTSKIVRSINKIKNPDMVFGGLKSAENIEIGGRKGKTLLVTDQNQRTARIDPNNVHLTTETVGKGFKPVSLKKCFNGKDVTQINNNKNSKFLNNLSNKEKARINRVVDDAAKRNTDTVRLAMDISDTLGVQNVEEFLSVVEIVSAEIDIQLDETPVAVNNIRADYNKFVENIKSDLKTAEQLASQRKINFRDPYKAVYHYRKHGSEFPSKIQSIKVYLNKVPSQLITDSNIAEIMTNKDGTITKIYNTSNDDFASVVENVDSRIIKTMYKKNEGYYETFQANLKRVQDSFEQPQFVDPLREYVTDRMGFRGFAIQLILENGEKIDLKPNPSS